MELGRVGQLPGRSRGEFPIVEAAFFEPFLPRMRAPEREAMQEVAK